MPSQEAIEIAARCWCDPRTEDRAMDVVLALVFAEVLDKYWDDAYEKGILEVLND